MLQFIYKIMPVSAQNTLCSLYGYLERRKRFSSDFYEVSAVLTSLDKANLSKLQSEQADRLIELLLYLAKHVPKYKNCIDIEQAKTEPFKVLESLPIVDKSIIIGDDTFISKEKNKKFPFKTSGTSGKGFSFFKCKLAIASQWAVWFRHRTRFGAREGDLHVNFMGKPLVPDGSYPYWRYNKAFNQYLIPMQVIDKDKLPEIVTFLNSIKPVFYSGYPSIISEVARLSIEDNLMLKDEAKPKFIFTGAEPLLETQKQLIENWTGAKVSQQYGMTEGACNISECEYGRYHEDMEFGYIEKYNPTINEDGSINAEIVGTSFYNFAQPFVRYRTGDTATWEPDGFSCECNRGSRVIRSIEGRLEDYVILNDGRKVMRFDYLFKSIPEIEEAQVVQRELGRIEIHYVTKEHEINIDEIKKEFKVFFGDTLEVDFMKVDSIEREGNGKFRSVKSLLMDQS